MSFPLPPLSTDHDGGIVAVIPIRSLTDGKSRLASALSPDQRATLIRRMMSGVIGAAAGSGVLTAIVVVSPDSAALAYAQDRHPSVVPLLQDPERPGLIPALDASRDWAEAQDAAAILILFGDLPLVTPTEVRNLARRDAPVVLAPDRHGTGTNAMLLRLDAGEMDHDVSDEPQRFQFQFGSGSYGRHVDEADRLGWDVATAIMSGTALDLDTPDDLDAMIERADELARAAD